MVPIVVSMNDELRVLGLSQASKHRAHKLDIEQLHKLIRANHARHLDLDGIPDNLSDDTVALWLGSLFLMSAENIDLVPEPIPESGVGFRVFGGYVLLRSAKESYELLENWIIWAFRRFNFERNIFTKTIIAGLMNWTLPNRPETLAALWATSNDPSKELSHQIRVFAQDQSKDELLESHMNLLASADYNF
jgi:hypothetical protein